MHGCFILEFLMFLMVIFNICRSVFFWALFCAIQDLDYLFTKILKIPFPGEECFDSNGICTLPEFSFLCYDKANKKYFYRFQIPPMSLHRRILIILAITFGLASSGVMMYFGYVDYCVIFSICLYPKIR